MRTIHRFLAANNQTQERLNQSTHPVYAKPELLATGPNQVWIGDIAKINGSEVDLLPLVCHSGYIQPLGRGLDDCAA